MFTQRKIPQFFLGDVGILPLFFAILLVSLFLGDGKQTIVDLFIASAVFALYGIGWLRRSEFRPLPTPIASAWTIFIGYYLVRTIFSDSVGYSISSLVRILEAFLVYRLFFAISSESTLKLFTKYLLALVTIAAGLSVLFLFIPALAHKLPSMNLVYANYGHNHLADLLLLVLPLAGVNSLKINHRWATPLFFFLFVTTIFTVARGALLLLAAYFLWEANVATHIAPSRRRAWLGAGAILLVSFVALVTFFSATEIRTAAALAPPWITKQLTKSAPIDERRLDYWRQAILAIRERPWFGGGPGTFYLQSLRFQRLPQSYSWFAHSFPLQIAAEVGVVGLVLLVMLLAAQAAHVWRDVHSSANVLPDTSRAYSSSLLVGLLLTMVYSFYEFNLDFLLVWLLFWSILGLLTGTHKTIQSASFGHSAMLTAMTLVLLLVFYLASTSSVIATFLGRKTAAFLLAPYDTTQTLDYIKSQRNNAVSSVQYLDLIQFMHRRNPQILYALAQGAKESADFNRANNWYREALKYDPKNEAYRIEYLRFLNNNRLYADMAAELTVRGAYGLSGRWTVILYDHGYREILKKNYAAALPFWSAAAAASPTWSHPAIELASLQLVLDDNQGARTTLTKCSTNIHAGRHCQMALEWLQQKSFPAPGSLAKEISPNH